MSDIDALEEHFRDSREFEFDHAVDIYIEPGKRLSWRDVNMIRECGYRIQHITNNEYQACVSLVKNDD